MIILLSSSEYLYWLGCYISRLEEMCRQWPLPDDTHAQQFSQAFSLPFESIAELNQLICDVSHPQSIPAIRQRIDDNVQSLRGVMASDLFIQFVALRNQSLYQNLLIVIKQINQNILLQPTALWNYYQLGRCIEQLDLALHFKRPVQEIMADLAALIQLPELQAWQQLNSWKNLQQQPDLPHLQQFYLEQQAIFAGGQ